jgi:hypothetical protein
MSRSATTAGIERLLHASPQRTVFAAVDASGETVVHKVFVSGSQHDAERELAMARRCAQPGVLPYRDVAIEPVSNRPCLTTAFATGTDLGRIVADHGAVPAVRACELLIPVAETLAAMHGLRDQDAPFGICHGDIKPTNLLRTDETTLLLDFEHARPIATPTPAGERARSRFSGGSFEFAPPEALQGASPDATFDVYGLGATLHWLATAGGRAPLPQHARFAEVVVRCMHSDATQRPNAAQLAVALRELAKTLATDPDEAVLDAAARGDAPGPEALAAARPGLERACQKRGRLLRRLPHLLDAPNAVPTDPAALRREIATALRVLRWFPRHPESVRWLRELSRATGRLLADAASKAHSLRRSEEFAAAEQWLRDAADVAQRALDLPGGCPIPLQGSPANAGLLHRDPLAFLKHLAGEVENARIELEGEIATTERAESALDLDAAERAVDAIATRYGGSSPTATRQRDRLHRLGFYLQRIARARSNTERVASLWDAVALAPLSELVAKATATCEGRALGDGAGGVVGLRSLQITLVNLAEEFPHLPQAAPALDALTQALAHLTDQGWELLADAEKSLRTQPVPVRPLQVALSRLDTYRILEAFVDRPDRPRSRLQDALESLRLRLDQARAARDRLAKGAEHAMARGHWTTGLFDMERAIAELNPMDERERHEAARLRERLAEAKRRKQEVEAAVRRNVELATRYGTMQDDPSTSFAQRLHVLAERRDCLQLLSMYVPAERVALYGHDLRDVETQIALEEAARAEHEFDGTLDPVRRLQLARHTADQLSASVAAHGLEPPGRLLRQLEHWRTAASHCQRAVEQAAIEREARLRNRRRLWSFATGAIIVCALAIGAALRPWFNGTASAATRGDAGAALRSRVATLPESLREHARGLFAAAMQPGDAGPEFDVFAWHEQFRAVLAAFAERAAAEDSDEARAFAAACWEHALGAASERTDDACRDALDRETAQLATLLSHTGLQAPAR